MSVFSQVAGAQVSPCAVNQGANVTVANVQTGINEAPGVAPANNDLNNGGGVNVTDVQIVINAALGLGCAAAGSFTTNAPVVTRGIDNTLGVELPIVNGGAADVQNVAITAIQLSAGNLLAPTSLPVPVGDVAQSAHFTVQAVFDASSLSVGANYVLTVHGTYTKGSGASAFSVNRPVTVPAPPKILIGVNTTDQLLAEARTSAGGVMNLFGPKDSHGQALGLSNITINSVTQGLVSYTLDSQGRPLTIASPTGATFTFIWTSSTSGVVTAVSADGTQHVTASITLSNTVSNQIAAFPPGTLLGASAAPMEPADRPNRAMRMSTRLPAASVAALMAA